MTEKIRRNPFGNIGNTFINNPDGHSTVFIALDQLALQFHHLNEFMQQNNSIVEHAVSKDGKLFMTEYTEMMDDLKKMQETLELFEQISDAHAKVASTYFRILS